MNAGNGKAEQWLISFTQQLRNQLPAGQYIITHARMSHLFYMMKGSLTPPYSRRAMVRLR